MNPHKGEYKFNVEGVGDIVLRLNMGALAEIEAALGCKTVGEMVVRIGNLGVKDVLDILRPLVKAGGNEDLSPISDWPPVFGEYTVAIGECFFASGFLRRPKTEESASPNSEGQ
jgi:hypothetical protein